MPEKEKWSRGCYGIRDESRRPEQPFALRAGKWPNTTRQSDGHTCLMALAPRVLSTRRFFV